MNRDKNFLSVIGITFLLTVSFNPSRVTAAKSMSDMTGPWQLFVDDYLIAVKTNVVRTCHPFEKYAGNPIMVADKPWEHKVVTGGTVLPNESGTGYRMWYSCRTSKEDPARGHPLYATSEDGITWIKPNLGLVAWYDGSTDNNILPHRALPIHTPWNTDPKHRYTSMAGHKGRYGPSWSEDGIHWVAATKPQLQDGSDVGKFQWDPHTKQYRGYVKVIRDVNGLRRRCVGFSSTTDIESWPPLELVMTPDGFDDRWTKKGSVQRTHFYGCPVYSYETMYIGLVDIFRGEDEEGYFHGPVFTELVTSRDGIHWLREEGERPRLLDVGPPGTWDDGMVYTRTLMVVDDTMRLYYTGADDLHDISTINAGLGLATLRKDGFVSLDAMRKVGTITTKRFQGTRGPLHVNFTTNAGGWLCVEVLDEDGYVLPGYKKVQCEPLKGDSLNTIVTWGDKTELPVATAPLRLRFIMRNASLYSFMAGDAVQVIQESTEPILAALYTFEKDKGKSATDELQKDGVQSVRCRGRLKVDPEPENAAFGSRSLAIGSRFGPLNTMMIDGTSELGTQFTLAVMAKNTEHDHTRLFSSHDGGLPIMDSALVFDCDPSGKTVAGLRLICKGISVESEPVTFDDGKYHHLAVVYDDGEVKFYLDGKNVGRVRIPGGMPVLMKRNLHVGEDTGPGSNEQFIGHMDDILVLGRALTADEVKSLSQNGAEALFGGG